MRFAIQPHPESFFQPSARHAAFASKPNESNDSTGKQAFGSEDITLWGNYTESSRLEEMAHIILSPNDWIHIFRRLRGRSARRHLNVPRRTLNCDGVPQGDFGRSRENLESGLRKDLNEGSLGPLLPLLR